MTLVTYTPKPDLDGATDVLVLGVAPDGDGARLVLGHALSRRPAAALLAAAATVGATGRAGQVHVVPATAGLRAGAVVLVGLGEAPSPATLREAAGAALRAAPGQRPAATCPRPCSHSRRPHRGGGACPMVRLQAEVLWSLVWTGYVPF